MSIPAIDTRQDDARQRLVEAALEVFSEAGFEGATTRAIAQKADVNISAIKYYFGNKEGLYEAVVEHMIEFIEAPLKPAWEHVRRTLERKRPKRKEARALLEEFVGQVARVIVGPEHLNRFVVMMMRAQLDGSPPFERFFERVMKNIVGTLMGLISILLRRPPEDMQCRLHAVTLMGQMIVFRHGRRGVLRVLGWKQFGEDELSAVIDMLRQDIEARYPV